MLNCSCLKSQGRGDGCTVCFRHWSLLSVLMLPVRFEFFISQRKVSRIVKLIWMVQEPSCWQLYSGFDEWFAQSYCPLKSLLGCGYKFVYCRKSTIRCCQFLFSYWGILRPESNVVKPYLQYSGQRLEKDLVKEREYKMSSGRSPAEKKSGRPYGPAIWLNSKQW